MAGVKNKNINLKDDEKNRFCSNPFSKKGHANWRKTMKLTKVTDNLLAKLEAIGIATRVEKGQRICGSCKTQIHAAYRDGVHLGNQQSDVVHAEDDPLSYYGLEQENVHDISENEATKLNLNVDLINDILKLLNCDTLSARQCRKHEHRLNSLRLAVDSLKKVFNVTCDIIYDETEIKEE